MTTGWLQLKVFPGKTKVLHLSALMKAKERKCNKRIMCNSMHQNFNHSNKSRNLRIATDEHEVK